MAKIRASNITLETNRVLAMLALGRSAWPFDDWRRSGRHGRHSRLSKTNLSMRRSPLVVLVAIIAGMLAPCGAGGQQPAKVPRVGILFAGTPTAAAQFNESFTQGLRERGYVEGRTIIVERRYAGMLVAAAIGSTR